MSFLRAHDRTIHSIDPLYGKCGCTRAAVCDKYVNQFMRRMVGRYVGRDSTFRRQIESAVIPLRGLDFDDYMARVKQVHKGAALRQARKADRAGLHCRRFVWKNFIPDIVEINTSMEVRSGGEMKPAYHRSVEEMGGPPTRRAPLNEPECPVHCMHCWGVFEPRPGHRQGDIVTDEKLVAYIKFKRQGSLAIYTSILGHGDYLKLGIMYRLHYAIMEWVASELDGPLRGLDHLLYGAMESGAEGLQQWKKRCLFEGAYLVLPEETIPTHVDASE